MTMDAYSIAIGNRITTSSTVNSTGGAINTPLVTQAIALVGVTLDPTATQQGVTAFLNGHATLTQGIDITVNYPTDFGDIGPGELDLGGQLQPHRDRAGLHRRLQCWWRPTRTRASSPSVRIQFRPHHARPRRSA